MENIEAKQQPGDNWREEERQRFARRLTRADVLKVRRQLRDVDEKLSGLMRAEYEAR